MKVYLTIKRNIAKIVAWYKYHGMFRKFLIRSEVDKFLNTPTDSNKKVAVIIHAWNFTPAPYFTIAMGIFLARMGNQVEFIIDNNKFKKPAFLNKIQTNSLFSLLKLIPKSIRVTKISDYIRPGDQGLIPVEEIEELAKLNTIHFMRGELKEKGRAKYYSTVSGQLKKANLSISSFFQRTNFDYLYLAGGIFSTTGLYLNLAKRFGVRVNTYDSGQGVILTSVCGIAAQLSDLPIAFQKIKEQPNDNLTNTIIKEAKKQLKLRRAGKDSFSTQVKAETAGPRFDPGCLILLNSPWDSAALGIHQVFNGYAEWLTDTIAHILANTRETVTIRQHPSERYPIVQSNDNYSELIEKKFGKTDRIKFVDAYSDVNTYQLMNEAKLIICFSSTAGIESVLLNKPVIVASRCYYSKLGFVQNPKTRNEYFQVISSILENESRYIPDNAQMNDAYICYFLGQCCNWVFMEFTPTYKNFIDWVNHKELKGIYTSETVKLYLYSINNGIPLSYIVSQKKLEQNTVQDD